MSDPGNPPICEPGEPAPAAGPTLRRRTLQIAGIVLLVLLALAIMPTDLPLVSLFFHLQDLPVALGMLALFAVLTFVGNRDAERSASVPASATSMSVRAAVLAVGVLAIGYTGHYAVLHGYAFSRDEQMALFDAEIFRSGRIVARIAAEWQPFFRALNPLFMPESLDGSGWVSSYRPVNALLHAAGAIAGSTALVNPVLAALGLLATWQVARQVFPEDSGSQTVAIVLYATSSQVLTLAMTSYAMTGHLALNMVWLALLLHDRWYSHLGALVVGFLATGLHQLVYHPLFAGPFLFFLLVMRRRWAWSLAYALAYAAGIYFWSKYAGFAMRELGIRGVPADSEDFLLTRLLWALGSVSWTSVWAQSAYVLRFLTWDNALLLPLLVAATVPAVRSRDPRLVAMIVSILGLVLVKLILRPDQGHGWGYRYIHGWVGVACILAAFGWRELRARGAIGPRDLVLATAATMLLFVPFQWWRAHTFSGLYARIDRAIASSDADVVVVDDRAPGMTQDLVINPPDLDRRPVRLMGSRLDAAHIVELCRRGSVAFVSARDLAPIAAEFGQSVRLADQSVPPLRAAARAAGCDLRQVSFGR